MYYLPKVYECKIAHASVDKQNFAIAIISSYICTIKLAWCMYMHTYILLNGPLFAMYDL